MTDGSVFYRTKTRIWRQILAAVLVSLVIGGLAGGLVGGGVAWLVMQTQEARTAATVVETVAETEAEAVAATAVPTPQPQAGSVPSAVPASLQEESDPLVAAVERVGPTVVTVVNQLAAQPGPWGSSEAPTATGSGVIVDPRGYIVTNYHVVEDAVELNVIFADGTSWPAQLVGHDYPFSDLALIQVQGEDYPYATLGDSDSLQPGEQVIAIGSALGDFRNTVTSGVISGLGRDLQVSEDVVMEGLIQTDAAINHGNSGGPLVNAQAEVVGLNTAIIRGGSYSGDNAEGLGFSIPSNTVRYVVDQLIERGKVARPFLGVGTVTITPRLAAYYNLPVDQGIYVESVVPDSPAARAGIQTGDIITAIGESTIDEEHPLINVLSRYESGQQVDVTIYREGRSMQVELVLGERP